MEKVKHIKNYVRVRAKIKKWSRDGARNGRDNYKFLKKVMEDKGNWDGRDWIVPEKHGGFYKGMRFCEDFPDRCLDTAKYYEKSLETWMKRLDNADKAGKLAEIIVSVERKKNRTWGMNPTAEVWVCWVAPDGSSGVDHAESSSIGGCGYDKVSTAVSEAFNNLKEGLAVLDRFVIERQKIWGEYVFDKEPFSHFSFGGKGMSTFTHLFPRIGTKAEYRKDYACPDYVIEEDGRSRTHDYYHVIRRDLV